MPIISRRVVIWERGKSSRRKSHVGVACRIRAGACVEKMVRRGDPAYPRSRLAVAALRQPILWRWRWFGEGGGVANCARTAVFFQTETVVRRYGPSLYTRAALHARRALCRAEKRDTAAAFDTTRVLQLFITVYDVHRDVIARIRPGRPVPPRRSETCAAPPNK